MKGKKMQYVGSIERESITVTILLLLAASLILTTSCSSTSKVATSSSWICRSWLAQQDGLGNLQRSSQASGIKANFHR